MYRMQDKIQGDTNKIHFQKVQDASNAFDVFSLNCNKQNLIYL